MELLPQSLRESLPPLGAQEKVDDPIVHLKFFCPWNQWTWLATEGGEEDGAFRFFGFVVGQEDEWGYFLLQEMDSLQGPAGLKIERDLHFKPCPISEVLARRERN